MDTQEIQESVPDRLEHAISRRRVGGGEGERDVTDGFQVVIVGNLVER